MKPDDHTDQVNGGESDEYFEDDGCHWFVSVVIHFINYEFCVYYHEYDADKPSDKRHIADITSTPEQLFPLSKHLSDILKTSLFKSKMRKVSKYKK